MEKEKEKKIIAGAGIAGGMGLLLYLLLRKKPEPGMANLFGQVTDAENGEGIYGIQVSFNKYLAVTKSDGYYLIENITPGEYEVTFSDPLERYETLVV